MRWIGLGAAILVLFIVLNIFKSLYVDWLWFDSVGFGDVFRRRLLWSVLLFVIGAAVSAVVIGVNIWLARRYAPVGVEESFIEEVDPQAIRRIVTVALLAATLFLAVIFGSFAGGAWETVLSWLNAVDFGVDDPQFNRDVSFYLFDLPAYQFAQGWLLGLLIVSALGAGAVYALALSLQRFELTNVTRGMRIHLSVLLGLIVLLITLGTYFGIFDLATAPGGLVSGATYTDVNARLPVRWILIVLGIFAGLATIANSVLSNGYRLPIFSLGLWALAGFVGLAIYPSIVQRTSVDPNELDKEREFIARNITMTRLAYGLDIQPIPFPAVPTVTFAEVEANPATIDNIRLLDARPLRDTFNQLQSLRPFYVFNDIDIDRYTIDGQARQLMVSARELDIRRAQGNWTRERLQLTHGYGAVVAPVNQVTDQGQPELLTRDIPPVGDIVPISTETAQIYFGELTTHYVIVQTDEDEFDYPVGESFAPTRYTPDRGIRLGNVFRRLLLSWDLGDANLLISGRIGSGSRLLIKRTLNERISEVAPFLKLDADPYLVIDGGRLMWIQDAYTTASNFPYSQSSGDINYIRNSVKITVDAITGDMMFYQIDKEDPIIRTWAKIFPDLFIDADEMPASVRAHLRYPEDLFFRQAVVYLRYHITDPDVFFVGEDLWNIPSEKFRQQEQPLEPYYVILTLPGEQQEEFALIMPFTPRNKQNTIAWLAGRSDGENLGTLRAYRFPTDELVLGPAQIEAKIDQDTGISQQLTLWDQSGSEVIRGNLLMIPVGDSFLYVEPIYLQAETSRFPELKRVVVANGESIAMETTFRASLDVVFGRRASTLPGAGQFIPQAGTPAQPSATPAAGAGTVPSGDLGALLQQAEAAASEAQRQLDTLRSIIDAIQQQQGQ